MFFRHLAGQPDIKWDPVNFSLTVAPLDVPRHVLSLSLVHNGLHLKSLRLHSHPNDPLSLQSMAMKSANLNNSESQNFQQTSVGCAHNEPIPLLRLSQIALACLLDQSFSANQQSHQFYHLYYLIPAE